MPPRRLYSIDQVQVQVQAGGINLTCSNTQTAQKNLNGLQLPQPVEVLNGVEPEGRGQEGGGGPGGRVGEELTGF